MQFPLYHRPNAFVFLDDDPGYLDMLAIVMPAHWCVRLYTHVDGCIDRIKQEHSLWEEDVWSHFQITEGWRTGAALIPQILQYWQTNASRYGLTKVLIVDFSMPAMTGLDVLKMLPNWPSNRVLLTGKADEMVAVTAFNQGLIDQFVPKQHPDIGKHLTEVLAEQHASPMYFHESIWRNALKKEQFEVLRNTSVQQDLTRLVEQRGWVEYFVIPEPFGILAIDAQARAHWLQLEQTKDLAAAADLAQSTGQPANVVHNIRTGTHLANTELLMTLYSDAPVALATTFKIGSADTLVGAFFALPAQDKLGVGHSEFLASQPRRAVLD
jgi:CheY-like chemotaxis protein